MDNTINYLIKYQVSVAPFPSLTPLVLYFGAAGFYLRTAFAFDALQLQHGRFLGLNIDILDTSLRTCKAICKRSFIVLLLPANNEIFKVK